MNIKIRVIFKSQTLEKVLSFSITNPLYELEFLPSVEELGTKDMILGTDLLIVEVDESFNDQIHCKIQEIKKIAPHLKTLMIADLLVCKRTWNAFDDQIDRLFEVNELVQKIDKILDLTEIKDEDQNFAIPEAQPKQEINAVLNGLFKLDEPSPESSESIEPLDSSEDEWDVDEEFECLEVEIQESKPETWA
jgi:hypothetical protein